VFFSIWIVCVCVNWIINVFELAVSVFRGRTAPQHVEWLTTCIGTCPRWMRIWKVCKRNLPRLPTWPKGPIKPSSTWKIRLLWPKRTRCQVTQATAASPFLIRRDPFVCYRYVTTLNSSVHTVNTFKVFKSVGECSETALRSLLTDFFFTSDPYHKRSTSILEDIVRFEKTSIAQEQQI